MRKFISIILALAVTLSFCVIPTSAANAKSETTVAIWNGKADTSWFDGKKTSYDISTAEQLAGLSKLVWENNSMEGVTINLTANIILNDTKGLENWETKPPKNVWIPIGYSKGNALGYMPFAGVFNGNGHKISGMYVKSGRTAGLFGYIYCAGVSKVIIEKSYVMAKSSTDSVFAGAITGIAEGSVINECDNRGTVYAWGPADCLSGDNSSYAGGIAGSLKTENMSGLLLKTALAAGGIFVNPALFNDGKGGVIKSSGVANCVNSGTIKSNAYPNAYVGGIVGNGDNGIISNSLNLGKYSVKSSHKHLGSIAGELFNCNLSNCYFYSENSKDKGVGSIGLGGSAKDTAIMKTKEGIIASDFPKKLGDAFVFVKGDRPHLKSEK